MTLLLVHTVYLERRYFGTPTYFRSLKPPDLPVLYGWKGGRNKDTASAEK